MKKILFTAIIALFSVTTLAGFDVGMREQKLNFTKTHLTNILEIRGYKLKESSLELKESLFNIVSSFSEFFVPGGKDEQYVEFQAINENQEVIEGYVRLYTDSFIPRFSENFRGEAVGELIDPSTNDTFYIWLEDKYYDEVPLHLNH